ncbi:MAG: hypothetical protein RL641_751 [Candidatus Parcubacteria bacterium]|jgi:S1-C subfamily serine protease
MFKKMINTIKQNMFIIATSMVVSILTVLMLFGIISLFTFSGEKFSWSIAPNFLKDSNTSYADNDNGKTSSSNYSSADSPVVSVVEKASPAVVSIVITKDVPIIEQNYQEYSPFGDSFFNDFFGGNTFQFRVPQQRQKGTEKREIGGGSGFFISSDGYIVTNKHVVEDESSEYTVLTNDGKKYDAKILAKDDILDVAILKVKGSGFSYLSFGNSDQLKPGQTAIAIGNALAEFRNSVSVGVISGLSRSITAGDMFGKSEQLEGVIQTDAAINPGNSGGPLLDIKGKVIGVNVAVSQGAENIGFALTSNTVKGIVDSVRENGEIVRPYLGIRYTQITETLKKKNNISVDYGVLVRRGETNEDLAVIPGSPADKAGIVENDIILEIDGVQLKEGQSLGAIIRQKEVGQTIKLLVLHKESKKVVEVRLEKSPRNL